MVKAIVSKMSEITSMEGYKPTFVEGDKIIVGGVSKTYVKKKWVDTIQHEEELAKAEEEAEKPAD